MNCSFGTKSKLYIMKALVLICVLTVLCQADKVRYDGYKVVRLTGPAEDVNRFVRKIERSDNEKLDVWSRTDIMASPDMVYYLSSALEAHGMPYVIMIDDVQRVIEFAESNPQNAQTETKDFQFDQYHTHAEINHYLESVAENDATGRAQIFTIGQSYEGRSMKMLKIGESGSDRNAVWIDCGIHAREWIAPAMCVYFIDKLMSNDEAALQLTKYVDFYILPVVNPDGYDYTFEKDRMWRKTRSKHNGNLCVGVDANRNYDYFWGGLGTSSNPCSNIYHGPHAFSEVELQHVRDELLALVPRMKLFLAFHSYSQMFLFPYGHTIQKPWNYDDLVRQSTDAANALASVYGTLYTVGTIPEQLGFGAGGSIDWVHGELKIEYTYGVELRDKGRYGFLLPADQIIPSGIETWEALKVLVYDACAIPQQ